MTLYVAPIVEGQTEAVCLPGLLERVWGELLDGWGRGPLVPLPPDIVKRSSILKERSPMFADRLERAAGELRKRCKQPDADRGFVLVLLDAEEDCPKLLSEQLKARAALARGDADVAVVCPKRQLENWFKAAAASLAGSSGLPIDLGTPADPELGNAANWFTDQMQKGDRFAGYDKILHGQLFARQMDLAAARAASPSFDKLVRELKNRLPPQPPEPPCTASA